MLSRQGCQDAVCQAASQLTCNIVEWKILKIAKWVIFRHSVQIIDVVVQYSET